MGNKSHTGPLLKELTMKAFKAITRTSIFEVVAVDEVQAALVLHEDAGEELEEQLEYLGDYPHIDFSGIIEQIII